MCKSLSLLELLDSNKGKMKSMNISICWEDKQCLIFDNKPQKNSNTLGIRGQQHGRLSSSIINHKWNWCVWLRRLLWHKLSIFVCLCVFEDSLLPAFSPECHKVDSESHLNFPSCVRLCLPCCSTSCFPLQERALHSPGSACVLRSRVAAALWSRAARLSVCWEITAD